MKVSRKVARRKHSRSSFVSRKRFRNKKSRSGYRKKHTKTQKGGKRGRGQKRMGARTHKRGKRFHRGGVEVDCYESLFGTKDSLLRYKKEGTISTPDTKPFNVEVYGYNGSIEGNCRTSSSVGKIVLERQTPENPVTITMRFRLLGMNGERAQILSDGSGDNKSKYSFNFSENNEFFKDFFDRISANNTDKRNTKISREQEAKKAKEEEENQKMDQARQTFRDVQENYKEMKNSEYTGDYSQLRVDLFPYMTPSEQEQERITNGNDRPDVMVNFKDFKEEQEQLANDTKEAINGSSLEQSEKDSKKSEVDNLLKKIIDNQKELMLATYFMDEAFKGEYGGKVYTEETQGQRNAFNEERGIVQDGNSTYYHVQKDIKKMKNLAANLTTADVVTTEDSVAGSEVSETLTTAGSSVAAATAHGK